ncbi:MAG: hypothetical protein AB1554_16490 [Chloroflexota bacterium]
MVKIQFRDTPNLWDGMLETPASAKSYREADGISASIGEPFQWADGEMLGEKWKPPVGGHRFYLVQLAFTLSPQRNMKVTSADFCLTLSPQGGNRAVVFDAFPREQTVEQSLPVTLGIGPDFKFGTTEASLAKAETTVDFGRAIPVIHVEGLQEPRLCWRYSEHAKYPLKGSRRMVAIVSLPAGMKTALATFELTVTASDRFGKIFLEPPRHDTDRLRFVVGERGG